MATLIKENFDSLANEASENIVAVGRLQAAESILNDARKMFIKACADLDIDTEEELESLNSIDAVLERYSRFFT